MSIEAIQRCLTPHMESLSDTAVFNLWFREHPHDLLPLGINALLLLSHDFFSEFARYRGLRIPGSEYDDAYASTPMTDIPQGWEPVAWVAPVLNSGLCDYTALLHGPITMRDYFEMRRIMDWNSYILARSSE